MLLIHGDDDRNVSFIESINLITALRKRNVEVEQLVFPDEVHDFLRHQNWVRGYKAAAEFFNRRLKNKPATETRDTEPIVHRLHRLREAPASRTGAFARCAASPMVTLENESSGISADSFCRVAIGLAGRSPAPANSFCVKSVDR